MGTKLPTPVPLWPGCNLYVSPVIIGAGVTDGSGTWQFAWPIPNDATLVGLRIDEQFAVFDYVARDRFVMTNGGFFVVQA